MQTFFISKILCTVFPKMNSNCLLDKWRTGRIETCIHSLQFQFVKGIRCVGENLTKKNSTHFIEVILVKMSWYESTIQITCSLFTLVGRGLCHTKVCNTIYIKIYVNNLKNRCLALFFPWSGVVSWRMTVWRLGGTAMTTPVLARHWCSTSISIYPHNFALICSLCHVYITITSAIMSQTSQPTVTDPPTLLFNIFSLGLYWQVWPQHFRLTDVY